MTPQKYPQNLHTPNNIQFSETPPPPPPPPPKKKHKNIEIQNFEPHLKKKIARTYVCMKISACRKHSMT